MINSACRFLVFAGLCLSLATATHAQTQGTGSVVNQASPQSRQPPSVLDVIRALLFGSSFQDWLSHASLGTKLEPERWQTCRYTVGTDNVVHFSLPEDAGSVVMVEGRRAAFFLADGKLYRVGLGPDLLPESVAELVHLSEAVSLTMVLGMQPEDASRLVVLAVPRKKVMIIDLTTGAATTQVVTLDASALNILLNQAQHPDVGIALTETPYTGVAQLKIISGKGTSARQTLVTRLRRQSNIVPTLKLPRFSDSGRFLTYSASCGSRNCCVRRAAP